MKITTVHEVTVYLESKLNTDYHLRDLMLEGAVVSLSVSKRGHVFFTLKDITGEEKLDCVLFASKARLYSRLLKNGKEVVVHGSINYNGKFGSVRLLVERINIRGASLRQVALEELRQKLEAKGYFALERKKTLPARPFYIGIITSPHGAVIHDLVQRISARNSFVGVRLFPTSVQGDSAPDEIAAAVKYANLNHGDLDFLIVARGGGSQDDLNVYNNEKVLEAVFESKLPIVSAIGHESDVTLIDLVADIRAATPTHAAEISVPAEEEIYEHIINQLAKMKEQIFKYEDEKRQILKFLLLHKAWQALPRLIDRAEKNCQNTTKELSRILRDIISDKEQVLAEKKWRLEKSSPEAIFKKGYFWLESENKRIQELNSIDVGDEILITDSITYIEARVERINENERKKFDF